MLSYLHGFHAGNAADVLKHSVLIFCLEYLKKKEKPLLCADTHAGAGLYDFSAKAAELNNEWKNGIGRLLPAGGEMPPMLASYMKIAAADLRGKPAGGSSRYPGSPLIMSRLLSKGDRLVCFELHPREVLSLKAAMAEAQSEKTFSVEVRNEDGLSGLKSLLPPPSRRGLVFIDPPWEEQEEYQSVPRGLKEGLKRFPEGIFIVWYPLLALPKEKNTPPLSDTLFPPDGGKRCRLSLYTGKGDGAESPRGMYGSALVIYNPPWTLRSALEETMPRLAEILNNNAGSWRLEWEA